MVGCLTFNYSRFLGIKRDGHGPSSTHGEAVHRVGIRPRIALSVPRIDEKEDLGGPHSPRRRRRVRADCTGGDGGGVSGGGV